MNAQPDKLSREPMIDTEASQWVTRRRAGLNSAEARQLDAWLCSRPEHKEAFARLSAVSEVFQRARAQGTATSIVTALETRSRRRRTRRRVIGAAAVLVMAAILWIRPFSVRPVPSTRDPASVAASFEPIRRLPDGSIVELKTGAEIAVRFEPATRRVLLLRGEALFRVEKDAARPFVVRAQGVDVRAVGTAFNVRLETKSVEVLVTEGRVQVADAARGTSLLPALLANETPVLSAGQKVLVDTARLASAQLVEKITELTADEIRQRLVWRLPRLEFDGEDLATAVRQMNRENRVQIILAEPSLATLHLSGTFTPDDPATFARLVSATFGLKVQRRGDAEIVLTRE